MSNKKEAVSDKRKQLKVQKELLETLMLVDYLIDQGLSFENIENFSDQSVRQAKEWYNEQFS